MKKENIIFLVATVIVGGLFVSYAGTLLFGMPYGYRQASLSSVHKLDSCGKNVISELVKSTRHMATNSEVSTAKQLCADVAQDKILLTKAKQAGGNPYLLNAYTAAIAAGTPKGIATAIVHFDPNGWVHHVHSFHRIAPPHKYRTPYSIYAPDAILIRSKRNTSLQTEE